MLLVHRIPPLPLPEQTEPDMLLGILQSLPVMDELSEVENSYYAGCYCCSFDKDRPTLRGRCGFDEWRM